MHDNSSDASSFAKNNPYGMRLVITHLSKINLQKSKQQLGWNCFDIAAGIERKELVEFALAHASSIEFRRLLAPEIRHAATLAAIHMNHQQQITEEKNLALITLFELAEIIDDPTEKTKLQIEANTVLEKINSEDYSLF